MFTKIKDYFKGKKTYIVGVFTSSYAVLKVFNLINTTIEQDAAIITLLLALLGMSVGAKIDRK